MVVLNSFYFRQVLGYSVEACGCNSVQPVDQAFMYIHSLTISIFIFLLVKTPLVFLSFSSNLERITSFERYCWPAVED